MFAIGRNLVRSLVPLPVRYCRHSFKKPSNDEYEGSGGSHILPSGNPNYEGDGKTTVSVLNTEMEDDYLMVQTYSAGGFRLNNKVFVIGPIALFPKTILQWNIESMETLTPDAFILFTLLEPKVDVLIIGSGETKIHLNEECTQYLRKNRIMFELLPTPDAVPVFNFLNAERRNVAALLVPPADIFREGDTIANRILAASIKGTLFRHTTSVEKKDVMFKKMYLQREKREKELEEKERFLKSIKEDIINSYEKPKISEGQETKQLKESMSKTDKDKNQ